MSKFVNYLRKRELREPGILADDATNIGRAGLVASLGELLLHTKFGTPSGTVVSSFNALCSLYLLRSISRIYTAEQPTIQLPLFTERTHGRAEQLFDAGGAVFLTGVTLAASMNYDAFTHAPDSAASFWIGGGAVVAGLGMLCVGEELMERAAGSPEELTSRAQSDTIDQLSLFEQEF